MVPVGLSAHFKLRGELLKRRRRRRRCMGCRVNRGRRQRRRTSLLPSSSAADDRIGREEMTVVLLRRKFFSHLIDEPNSGFFNQVSYNIVLASADNISRRFFQIGHHLKSLTNQDQSLFVNDNQPSTKRLGHDTQQLLFPAFQPLDGNLLLPSIIHRCS